LDHLSVNVSPEVPSFLSGAEGKSGLLDHAVEFGYSIQLLLRPYVARKRSWIFDRAVLSRYNGIALFFLRDSGSQQQKSVYIRAI
jgi:hypothetical protein